MGLDFNLLKEFLDYGIDKAIQRKAQRVVILCLKNKKYDLAEKIERKYKLNNGNDDFITAFSLALSASQHVKRNGTNR